MNLKHSALILLFFVFFNGFIGAQTMSVLNPVTWERINELKNYENFDQLNYYLSRIVSLSIAEQGNVTGRNEIVDGAVRPREQSAAAITMEFNNVNSAPGKLRNNENNYEYLIINFFESRSELLIPLKFRRNSQGFYILFSVEYATRNYNIPQQAGLPFLCITGPVEQIEVRTVPEGVSQRPAGDNRGGQSSQGNSSAVNPSGRSRQIIGSGSVTPGGVAAYIRSKPQRPALSNENIDRLINIYFREAGVERVNCDIAVAQMLHWTNFLRNQERVRSNNYGGLSSTPRWNGRFPYRMADGMTEGVIAHIQHLKSYASPVLDNPRIVDPRHYLIENIRGSIQTFDRLYATWFPYNSTAYANSINRILTELYSFSERYL